MKSARKIVIVGVLVVGVCSGAPFAQPRLQTRGRATQAAPAAPKPWPDAKTLEDRRRQAENRPVFRSHEPLSLTLTADFKVINKDRNPNSTKTFPATIEVAKDDGTTATIALQIRTRGHVRRRSDTCTFAPLRLEFPKDSIKGTVFSGQDTLKLGTHCQDGATFEQHVLREYSAYRIYNLLTPRSFRARLARVTYVDSTGKKPIGTHNALFIEDDEDVARRLMGRITTLEGVVFRRVDRDTVGLMMLFEYMIGNTDLSIFVQHNVRLVQTEAGQRYPVPYDFDYSGLVDAGYAVPSKVLGIENVRVRLYRGPCLTVEEWQPFLSRVRTVKTDVMGLYDTLPDLTPSSRRSAKGYLEEFYRTIDRPDEVKRALVNTCEKVGM